MNRLINLLSTDRKKIFLFDGIGAMFSIAFTGFILPFYSDDLGIPKNYLQNLALFPCICCFYSLFCYSRKSASRLVQLRTVILLNSSYFIISGTFMALVPGMKLLGFVLLGYELYVLMMVVGLEYKIYQRWRNEFR